MQRKEVIMYLNTLNESIYLKDSHKIEGRIRMNVSRCQELCDIGFDDVLNTLGVVKQLINGDSFLSQYVAYNIYLLRRLEVDLQDSNVDDVLSVKEIKDVRDDIEILCALGIRCNLLNNIPQFLDIKGLSERDELTRHYCLSAVAFVLVELLALEKLKAIILINTQVILNALYQIIYCPLMKPNTGGKFRMTADIYEKLIEEREWFKKSLDDFEGAIVKKSYVRESLVLMGRNGANWFKKAVNVNLTKVLFEEGGIECIAGALIEDSLDYDDSTKIWRAVDVVTRLVMSVRKAPNFRSNIIQQIKTLNFDSIVIECTKCLFKEGSIESIDIARRELLPVVFNFEKIDEKVEKRLGAAFAGPDAIPISEIHFCVQQIINESNNLNDLIIKYVENNPEAFDYLIFPPEGVNKEIAKKLVNIFKKNAVLSLRYFNYLLSTLSPGKKHFASVDTSLNYVRSYVVYSTLAELADDKAVQTQINKNPSALIVYFNNIFRTEKKDNTLFLNIMVLQALISNGSPIKHLQSYTTLVVPLRNILIRTSDQELQQLILDVLTILRQENVSSKKSVDLNEVESALRDICEPMIPIRGHGLLKLAKLIRKRDKNALERKQYLLNIFQQHLKNEDSFIYLAAINGLAELCVVYPEQTIDVLTEEYTDFKRNDVELRMKLGEVLVKVLKNLDGLTVKYKSAFLNTFLTGARDEEDLIRASSLSNLGETCRILGYKLGSIITEILVCVHDVIVGDKSPHARRAAVSVFRGLFVGLGVDCVDFLKGDVLEIYKTLREIYGEDPDEVVRLQAQLALEELSVNVKNSNGTFCPELTFINETGNE